MKMALSALLTFEKMCALYRTKLENLGKVFSCSTLIINIEKYDKIIFYTELQMN